MKSRAKKSHALFCALCWFVLVFWLEAGWFAITALACQRTFNFQIQENFHNHSNGFQTVLLSDIHLLGVNRRKRVDIWWTDWQLFKSFRAIDFFTNHELVVVLGDSLDEGGLASSRLFRKYVERFKNLFHTEKEILHSTVGNHDVDLSGAKAKPQLRRWEKEFGRVNQVRSFRGVDFVTLNSLALANLQRGSFRRQQRNRTWEFIEGNFTFTQPERPRVLLLHVPLFRENDLDCGPARHQETGHVTYNAPHEAYSPPLDVLPAAETLDLLEKTHPHLVLSGHTHAQCFQNHHHSNTRTTELTVPPFSWRMRPDPSYALLYLRADHKNLTSHALVCSLPNEYAVFSVYTAAGLATLAWAFFRLCCYKKIENRTKNKMY